MELVKKLDGKLRLMSNRSCIGQRTPFQVERGVNPYDICIFLVLTPKWGSEPLQMDLMMDF